MMKSQHINSPFARALRQNARRDIYDAKQTKWFVPSASVRDNVALAVQGAHDAKIEHDKFAIY